MSDRRIVWSGNFCIGDVGEMSGRGIVYSGSCPTGNYPSGDCLSGICPSGKCPSGKCPVGEMSGYRTSLCNHLMHKLSSTFKLYVDGIVGFPNPSELFRSTRPDIVVKEGSNIKSIELTCPYETNTESSRNYKQKRYKNLHRDLLTSTSQFQLILLEITSLGFVTENIKDFNFLKKSKL